MFSDLSFCIVSHIHAHFNMVEHIIAFDISYGI